MDGIEANQPSSGKYIFFFIKVIGWVGMELIFKVRKQRNKLHKYYEYF